MACGGKKKCAPSGAKKSGAKKAPKKSNKCGK